MEACCTQAGACLLELLKLLLLSKPVCVCVCVCGVCVYVCGVCMYVYVPSPKLVVTTHVYFPVSIYMALAINIMD